MTTKLKSNLHVGPVNMFLIFDTGVSEQPNFDAVCLYTQETYQILDDVSVGALGLDSCGRKEKALQQVLNLENCAVAYGDTAIEPRKVLGYVGGSDHHIAVEVRASKACHPCSHRPITRYVKLRVAHAPGMPGTFSPPPRVRDPGMHHTTCVTAHVPWCMPG